jgi:cobaltochelatase CobS
MRSITELNLKTLVAVLKDLRGGSIGFDPFRNDKTNTKARLLAFILKEHTNTEIIAAISRVRAAQEAGESAQREDSTAVVDRSSVYVVYEPCFDRAPKARKFKSESLELSHAVAARWIGDNPQHSYKARLTGCQWYELPENSPYFGIETEIHETPKIEKGFDTKNISGVPTIPTGNEPKISWDFSASANDKLEALKKLLAPTIDEKQIHEVMDARAQDYVDNILKAVNIRLDGYDHKISALQMPVTVHVMKAENSPVIDLGYQHQNFPLLLKMAQARTKDGLRLNIWLKGPAGSGKTTAAKKISEALSLQFQSNGAISTEYELMGFKDASGSYHRTAFREVFEHGGVYLFDEVDSSLPKAVLAFNAALANGECRFPDAMINRHPDCVILAGANTAGNGANSDYVGRMKQDLAFLNRFVMLDWPLDETFEKALASNKDWVRKVQKFRANATQRGIKGHMISPRATFYGEALLAVGIPEEAVEQAVLRGSLSEDQWGSLCQ